MDATEIVQVAEDLENQWRGHLWLHRIPEFAIRVSWAKLRLHLAPIGQQSPWESLDVSCPLRQGMVMLDAEGGASSVVVGGANTETQRRCWKLPISGVKIG